MGAAVKAFIVLALTFAALAIVAVVSVRVTPENASTVSFLIGMPIGSASMIGWLIWARML